MLEDRVAVAKSALRRIERKNLAGLQVDRIERIKPVLQLHPISTDVLHRRGAHGARNQGHVFQAGPALSQAPGHQIVPIFTSTDLHNPMPIRLRGQATACNLHLEHQWLDITGEHQIAAPTKHKLGSVAQHGGVQHRLNVFQTAHPHQLLRPGSDAKGVVGLQRKLFLD